MAGSGTGARVIRAVEARSNVRFTVGATPLRPLIVHVLSCHRNPRVNQVPDTD